MATDKQSDKPALQPTAVASKTTQNSKNVLDKMLLDELGVVLRALLKKHPNLEQEVESTAVQMVSTPSVEDIASDVFDAVTSLGIDAFHGRTGKQSWGYVEPSQAAWGLLEEAVKDVIADMRLRMDLGLEIAAETICCGIVMGLHKAEGVGSDVTCRKPQRGSRSARQGPWRPRPGLARDDLVGGRSRVAGRIDVKRNGALSEADSGHEEPPPQRPPCCARLACHAAATELSGTPTCR